MHKACTARMTNAGLDIWAIGKGFFSTMTCQKVLFRKLYVRENGMNVCYADKAAVDVLSPTSIVMACTK